MPGTSWPLAQNEPDLPDRYYYLLMAVRTEAPELVILDTLSNGVSVKGKIFLRNFQSYGLGALHLVMLQVSQPTCG